MPKTHTYRCSITVRTAFSVGISTLSKETSKYNREPGYLKTPCIGKRTGLKKEYPTTHQCSRDILIISQKFPFATKNVKEIITNAAIYDSPGKRRILVNE